MELLKKLRLDNDKPLHLINAPDTVYSLFEGFTIKEKLSKEKPLAQVLLFAYDSAELVQYLYKLSGYIGHETLFWILYPKKSGSITSDLIEIKSWDIIFQLGYRGQTSVSLNTDWSGLRVTNAPPKKPSTYGIAPEDRKIEGIDFVKRTVQLPADAVAAMKKYRGLEDLFHKCSFTIKREYATAIVEAKKPETRTRRINKMIEELKQKLHAKK